MSILLVFSLFQNFNFHLAQPQVIVSLFDCSKITSKLTLLNISLIIVFLKLLNAIWIVDSDFFLIVSILLKFIKIIGYLSRNWVEFSLLSHHVLACRYHICLPYPLFHTVMQYRSFCMLHYYKMSAISDIISLLTHCSSAPSRHRQVSTSLSLRELHCSV